MNRHQLQRKRKTGGIKKDDDFFISMLKLSAEGYAYNEITEEYLLGDMSEIEKLTAYEFSNGEKILTKKNKSFVDNIISMLLTPEEFVVRLNNVKQYLENVKVESDIFNIPLFDQSREDVVKLKNMENWKPSGSKYAGKCPDCRNSNVKVFNINERALDEGAVSNYICLDCDKRWKKRG